MNLCENLFDKALMLAVYYISWKKGDEKVITYIYVLLSGFVVFFARFVAVNCTAVIYCGIKYIYKSTHSQMEASRVQYRLLRCSKTRF